MSITITIHTDAQVRMTVDEILDGMENGIQPIIEGIKSRGYEVTEKTTTSPEEKILQSVCDLHGISYFSYKEEILEVFKSQILKL